MPTTEPGDFWEQDGSLTILHTGIFATDEEVARCQRVSHAEAITDWYAGKPGHPIDRIAALCRAYGMPTRDDGAHWAIGGGNELCYAWPEGKETK